MDMERTARWRQPGSPHRRDAAAGYGRRAALFNATRAVLSLAAPLFGTRAAAPPRPPPGPRRHWMIGDTPPSHAVVALGANDGLRGLPPERMEANLDRIVTGLRARGVRILLAGMAAPPNLGRDYADRFAAVFPALAARHAVALYPFFLDGVAARPELNQQDGIHPNPAGVAVLVERILPAIRRLLDA
jgi:hypothetical protein